MGNFDAQKIEQLILHAESAQTDMAGNPVSMRSEGHLIEIAYRNGYPVSVSVDYQKALDEDDITDSLKQVIEKFKTIMRGHPSRDSGNSGGSDRTGQTSAQRQGILERMTAKLKDKFNRAPQMSLGYGYANQGSSMGG